MELLLIFMLVALVIGGMFLFAQLMIVIIRDDPVPAPRTEQDRIVPVRKATRACPAFLRDTVHDHWEGDGGIQLGYLPVEMTRLHLPEEYAEYMSPVTPASRKYELIDEVYSLGFTLPYIRGLNEQYKREREAALLSGDPDARTIHERTPVSLSPGKGRVRGLELDETLREVPQPDMDDPGSGLDNEEQTENQQQ